jgi:Lrp/AsnC family leucine-responsive transcriptional regulator
LLQRDALASTENLGDEVGLSPTAAKRRVNKMRAGGVIARDVSIVDHKQLGFDVFSLVFVNLERDRRDIMNNFKRAIREHPRILQAFYTTGDADFVLLVVSQTRKRWQTTRNSRKNFSGKNPTSRASGP